MGKVSEKDVLHLQMIRENVRSFLRSTSKAFDTNSSNLLDIAPQDHLGAAEFFTKAKIFTLDIDPNSGADYILDITQNSSDVIHDCTFDVVVCTEVLEHVFSPPDAINEIQRILKHGGTLLLSTPFDFRIHGPLPDCWRFTEHALRHLLSSFTDVQIMPLEQKDRFLMPIQYTVIAKK